MNTTNYHSKTLDSETIAKAIFVVNRHSKSALDLRKLYELKKRSLTKLLHEGKAKKVGIHTFEGKQCVQTAAVLIQVGSYFFHTPPTQEDFRQLNSLGRIDGHHRNPKVTGFSLKKAKAILYSFIGKTEAKSKSQRPHWNVSEYLGVK
jgi:hypothetical protein